MTLLGIALGEYYLSEIIPEWSMLMLLRIYIAFQPVHNSRHVIYCRSQADGRPGATIFSGEKLALIIGIIGNEIQINDSKLHVVRDK